MTRIISLIIISSFIISQEVTLSVGNFQDTGSSVSFYIMMINTELVQGSQFDLSVGDGTFSDDNSCVCTASSIEIPIGCDVCCYDYFLIIRSS